MTSIPDLRAEHRELEYLAATMIRVVRNLVPDPASVAVLRWRLAAKLADHCAREDQAVYAMLVASGDAPAVELAWRYRAEHARLASDFTTHIAAWPIDRIAREWEAFRAETEMVARILSERIALEEGMLYPHFERLTAGRRAAA